MGKKFLYSRSIVTTIRVLQSEIEVQKSRIQPHDTGHIHTTIGVLEDRVEELVNEVKGITSEG